VEEIKNLDVDAFIRFGMIAREENTGPPFAFVNGLNTSGNAFSTFGSTHTLNSAPNNFTYDASLSTDDAFWRVKFWTEASPDINRNNDTILFIQELSNYMAYDDGSAEMGYSLTSPGQLAYRFDIVGVDSIRALRMYFNPIANDPQYSPNPTQGSFLLTIWSSLSPPNIIHQDFSFSVPQYRTYGINKFIEYPLDSVVPVSGTFYVGWTQSENVRMNLGFDRNRNNQNKIFYRTGTSFQPTSFQGSLMMRPVFVSATDPFTGVPEEAATVEFALFPNPAGDAVAIRGEMNAGARLHLVDATGRIALDEAVQAGRTITVAALANGLYIARFIGADGGLQGVGRLLIKR
jgi:hypothetical protein